MTFAIYLITSFMLLSVILPLVGSTRAIWVIILFILLGVWLLSPRTTTYKFIKKESKESYRNLKRYIKKSKNYKRVAIPLNIIIVLYSACSAILAILMLLLVVFTFGIFLESPDSLGRKIYDACRFNFTIFPYILMYFLIIKNIIFDITLYNFFNKKTKNDTSMQTPKICPSCGHEATGDFCGNCGNKIN